MKKTKKLGKYFTKGLQAGVLATALMMGTAGCGNNAGGSTVEEEYPNTPVPPTTPSLADMTADEIRQEYNISDYSGIAFAPDNIDFAKTTDQAKVAIIQRRENHHGQNGGRIAKRFEQRIRKRIHCFDETKFGQQPYPKPKHHLRG